jgi:hypothetical protein
LRHACDRSAASTRRGPPTARAGHRRHDLDPTFGHDDELRRQGGLFDGALDDGDDNQLFTDQPRNTLKAATDYRVLPRRRHPRRAAERARGLAAKRRDAP